MVIMTHPEPLILYKPEWAILCYHELCRTVFPPRKWNLPSTNLSPSRSHCLLASKCLVCQSSTPGIDIHLRQTSFPRNHTPKASTVYPIIPYKVFSSWNSKDIRIIPAKESGDYSLKKELKMREENSTLPKSCKQGVQIKDQIPFPSMSPSPSISFTFHKIRIWLSSNPSWITIRLYNIGNEGMQHSPYP